MRVSQLGLGDAERVGAGLLTTLNRLPVTRFASRGLQRAHASAGADDRDEAVHGRGVALASSSHSSRVPAHATQTRFSLYSPPGQSRPCSETSRAARKSRRPPVVTGILTPNTSGVGL